LLTAALPVSREQSLWNNLPLPGDSFSGLLTDDGYLIFVWPPPAHPNRVYGIPQTGILVRTLRALGFPKSGHVQGLTTVDKTPRLVVFHRLSHYPLTFGITIPTRLVWMQWWRAIEAPYVLILLLAIGGLWTYRWTARHQKDWESGHLKAREQLHRANRALRVLTEVNRILVHAQDELTLLREVCRNLVEIGGYRMAWAGYTEHDAQKTIRPVVIWGHDDGYVENLQLTWADTERGRGPVGRSIRERRPDVVRDTVTDPRFAPWREAALARGYASAISLPVMYDDQVYGNICFYAAQRDAFDEEEVSITEQLASDVGYGVHTLRARLAHTHAEKQLRLVASALENTAEGVFITDVNAHIIFINKAFSTITGFISEEVIGRPWEIITSDRDDSGLIETLRQALSASGYWQGEFWARRKNGEASPALFSISAVQEQNGDVSCYVGVFNDISQYKDYQARLEFLATHDALTGLPNRMLLRDHLEEAIVHTQRDKTPIAVLFLDLDRFKSINDTLGHSVGDAVLCQVAERLRAGVRDIDTVARLGGDEFAVILSGCKEPSDAAAVAHKLRELVSRKFVVDSRELFVTASIGISCYPQDGDDVSTLLKNADIAMYRAKEAGRNMYQFFSADMNVQASEFMTMANSLHAAVERGEFALEFQPRHELATGRVTGVEALLRWHHPELGLILPARFIPLAEETGLIVSLGEWVLGQACQQASAWERAGSPLSVAVNLSARQFRERDLVTRLSTIIEASGVSPSLIEVEITESLMMQDPKTASRMLGELRALGVESAIDDFGTGYSSLAYL
ncbi:MAG: diguanylate cyclase, partial [Gammaproteobacteria bacterium]|nr:diguanylate cyclase [Gammaproteobacteria bacterium]